MFFSVTDSANSHCVCESDNGERNCCLCTSCGDGLFALSFSATGSSPLFVLISTMFAKELLIFSLLDMAVLVFSDDFPRTRWGKTLVLATILFIKLLKHADIQHPEFYFILFYFIPNVKKLK